MEITLETNEQEWESFLQSQKWSPFLQSFPMGEVYRRVGEEPVRLMVRDGPFETHFDSLRSLSAPQGDIVGICQAIVVPAKRGRHLAVMYGPVMGAGSGKQEAIRMIVEELKKIAREKDCAFIRVSPFSPHDSQELWEGLDFRASPLHLLAEHIWYLPLRGSTKSPAFAKATAGRQAPNSKQAPSTKLTEEEIFRNMRATTRNLIRRAEREGVTISVSDDPVRDLPHFLALHEETRKRHGFTPYTDDFFRAQVEIFSQPRPRPDTRPSRCALYLARFNGEVISASIHMIYGGETSYHHGASTLKYPKIPASYLLQWTAIRDALRRGDRVYNFWGIAPIRAVSGKQEVVSKKHPFAGVTTFKTGFGGELLELQHCMDLPLSKRYFLTWGVETIRKWRRGF